MAILQGKSTSFGADLYADFLLSNIQKFVLIGSDQFEDTDLSELLASSDLKYSDIVDYNIYEAVITMSGIDSNNQAYFNCVIPYNLNLGKFIHGVALVYDNEDTVEIVDWVTLTPFEQVTGIGGTIRYITSATGGTSGEIIFSNGDFAHIDEVKVYEEKVDKIEEFVNQLPIGFSGANFDQSSDPVYASGDVIKQKQELADTADSYDITTGTFIVPEDGFYSISARVHVNAIGLDGQDTDDGWIKGMIYDVMVYPDSGRTISDGYNIARLRIGDLPTVGTDELIPNGSRRTASDTTFVFLEAGKQVCIQFVYWADAPDDGKVDVTSTFSGYKVRL